MNIFRKYGSLRSVRAKFLAISIPIAVCLMLVLFGLFEYQTYRVEHSALHEKAESIAESHSAVLAESLWNVDDARVGLILQTLAVDPDIVGAAVFDDSGKLFHAHGMFTNTHMASDFTKSHDHGIEPFDAVLLSFIESDNQLHYSAGHNNPVANHEIVFQTDAGTEVIGNFIVFLTGDNILASTRKRLLWEGILIAAMMILIITSVIVAYGRSVGIPLSRMLESINTARKDNVLVPIDWNSQDEFGTVVDAFNGMVGDLNLHEEALHWLELQKSHDDLENQVRARTRELESLNQTLQDRTSLLARAEEVAQIGHWRWNLQSGHIDWSDTLYDIHGVDSELFELNEESVFALYHPDDVSRVRRLASKAIEDSGRYEVEARIIRPDGSERWLSSQGRCEQNISGTADFVFGVAQDITQRKLQEASLEEAKEEAEFANRAKSQFLAVMSHEVRTPLNGVLGLIGLMLETRLDSGQRHYLTQARESGEHLLYLLNDILDLSKLEANKFDLEELDFSTVDLVYGVIALMEARAQEKGITLRYDVEPDSRIWCSGDPGRLRQVLLNLVANAVKFTNEGSVVVSVSSLKQEDDRISLLFKITDTGVGIPKSEQHRLFEPFSQVEGPYRRKYGGSGLGLTISKRLVELMGGEIGFESTAGEGSTFWFSVTLDRASEDRSTSEIETASEPIPSSIGRILLVEDSVANVLVAATMLQSAGHTVDTAADGREAVEAVRSLPYDLILMDLSMPEMDGFEATSCIRALPGAEANTPIIAMTASSMSGDRENCLAAGMNDYISKPMNKMALLDIVAKWIDGKKEQVQAL